MCMTGAVERNKETRKDETMWRFRIERHATELAEQIRLAGVSVRILGHRDIVTDKPVWIVEITGDTKGAKHGDESNVLCSLLCFHIVLCPVRYSRGENQEPTMQRTRGQTSHTDTSWSCSFRWRAVWVASQATNQE